MGKNCEKNMENIKGAIEIQPTGTVLKTEFKTLLMELAKIWQQANTDKDELILGCTGKVLKAQTTTGNDQRSEEEKYLYAYWVKDKFSFRTEMQRRTNNAKRVPREHGREGRKKGNFNLR